jgi:hypothetical protein
MTSRFVARGCVRSADDSQLRWRLAGVVFGGGYVAMAIEDLKLPPNKIDTIADFEAVKKFGVQSKGGADAASAAVLSELADLIARKELEVPIAGVFALADVRDAFRQVELRPRAVSSCCDPEGSIARHSASAVEATKFGFDCEPASHQR